MTVLHSLSICLKALAILCGCRRFVQEVCDNDFGLPPHTVTIDEEQRERARRESYERSIHRCRLLRKRLASSFLIIGSALLAAGVIWAIWLRRTGASLTANGFCPACSVFAFAWATLGRLGWSGQSMGGHTIFERLDEFIFRVLYWIGTFFGILALWA